jgi:hypothetical protein
MTGGTRRGRVLGWWGMLAGASGCVAGCVAPPQDAEARLEALARDEARMDAAFDEVETRLLGGQARIHLWRELERRHGEVSSIQCRVADEHLRGIASHLEHQEQKELDQLRRRHMASAETVLTSGTREPLDN